MASLPVAGSAVWYDAADLATIVGGPGVSQWNDKSGNARHVVQATGANQPTTGARRINNLNALAFFNNTTRLDYTTSLGLTVSTIFVVAQLDTTEGGAGSRIMVDGISPGGRHVVMESSGVWSVYQGTATIGSIAADTLPHVHTGILTGSTTSGPRTDGLAGTTGNAGSNTLNGFRVGGEFAATSGTMWQGLIGEVIVYPSVLAVENIRLVEAYLRAKWFTPARMPVGLLTGRRVPGLTVPIMGAPLFAAPTAIPRSSTLSASLTDTLFGADTTARSLVESQSVSDGLLGADAVTRTVAESRTLSDSLVGADALTRAVTASRPVTDALVGADSVTRAEAASRATTDVLVGTDAVARTLIVSRATADGLLGADSLTRAAAHPRAVTDALLGTDTAGGTVVGAGGGTRNIVDQLVGADSATRALVLARTLVDVLLGTDTVTTAGTGSRPTSDILLGTDTATRGLTSPRTLTDVLTGGDALTRAFAAARLLTDVLLAGDTADSTAALARAVSDVLLGADTATGTVSLPRFLGGPVAGRPHVRWATSPPMVRWHAGTPHTRWTARVPALT